MRKLAPNDQAAILQIALGDPHYCLPTSGLINRIASVKSRAQSIFFSVMLGLTGCTTSSVMPLAADTIQITTSAAPVCGRTGAESVSIRRAAIETINRGFDSFMIVGGGYQNNVGVVGFTPVMANTYSTATATGYGNMVAAQGRSTTTYSGGSPIFAGTHDQGLIVKMFRNGDPAGANAVSARGTLGPNWTDIIKEGRTTTC